MNPSITETAFAKLNLALHVRERRADGFHAIETIFAFADRGDELTVELSDELRLHISGPFSDDLASSGDDANDNLVLRAARAMQAHFDVQCGATIKLTKNLPVAAGLGGGSADAAAAARALVRLWKLDVGEGSLIDAIGTLGADIPACVLSRAMRGEGVGDRFADIDAVSLSGLPLLLANPRLALSTAQVFERWNGQDLGALGQGDVMTAALEGRNDLERGAVALCPAIAEGLEALAGRGELLARMSGSGASMFALYPDTETRDSAAAAFFNALPDWWTAKAKLR